MSRFKLLVLFAVVLLPILLLGSGGVGAQEIDSLPYPQLYDPFTLRHIELEMSEGDWNTIVNDDLYDTEVPAELNLVGEDPVLVSVRRKSATKLGADKISLKVDINEYTDDFGNCKIGSSVPCVETWHGVKKLSLENGDDNNVLSEGLAWYLNRVASENVEVPDHDSVDYAPLDYTPGYASWVTVTVNGDSKGVYVNVEQRDKQFLKNHGLWEGGDETWLYKYSDIDSPEIKVGPDDESRDSPLFQDFCFSPFKARRPCDTPGDFKAQLNANINMESLLTLGAVSAFMYSPDDLFNKDKNFYFVDYDLAPPNRLREYTQWDLDSAFSSNGVDADIYNQGKVKSDVYEKALVEGDDPPFLEEYDAIMWRLLDGPFDQEDLLVAFEAIETEIGAAVTADPNNQVTISVPYNFGLLRQYVKDRRVNIIGQLPDRPETAPIVTITNPADGSTATSSVVITADASDADGSVAQVAFFVGGVSYGVDSTGDGQGGWTAPTAWDAANAVDGTYVISATATDNDGLLTTDNVTVVVDNVDDPPVVTVTYPTDGATVSGEVRITSEASDDKGVDSIEYFVDDVLVLSGVWDTTGLTNGTVHEVKAVATDTIGQMAYDVVSVTVNNQDFPPTVTVTNPRDGTTVSGTVQITADASDDKGTPSVEFFVDDVLVLSGVWITTGETNGTVHVVKAVATDTIGQTAEDSVSVTVDNAAPAGMHLGYLTGSVTPADRGKWFANVTITVHDSSHEPVSGVTVSGSWSGDYVLNDSCTTGGSGQCTLSTAKLNKNKDSVTFTVDDLSGALTYVPAENDVDSWVTITN